MRDLVIRQSRSYNSYSEHSHFKTLSQPCSRKHVPEMLFRLLALDDFMLPKGIEIASDSEIVPIHVLYLQAKPHI